MNLKFVKLVKPKETKCSASPLLLRNLQKVMMVFTFDLTRYQAMYSYMTFISVKRKFSGGPNFSKFHVVFGKICMSAPSPGGLAPPPTGNPISAPEITIFLIAIIKSILFFNTRIFHVRTKLECMQI